VAELEAVELPRRIRPVERSTVLEITNSHAQRLQAVRLVLIRVVVDFQCSVVRFYTQGAVVEAHRMQVSVGQVDPVGMARVVEVAVVVRQVGQVVPVVMG
jgi:hypothetical protein